MKSRLGVVAALSLATIALRCGGGDICLNCNAVPSPTVGPINTVSLNGDIETISTQDPLTSVSVIVCTDLPPSETAPEDFNQCPGPAASVSSTGTFAKTRITPGNLRIAFWIPRSDPFTGEIEPGDSFAELQDPEGELEDVRANQTVTVSSAVVDFFNMTATASIGVDVTPTPTPSSAPTPTPNSGVS